MIDGRDTVVVKANPMFRFYMTNRDPLTETVTYLDGTPAGINKYKTNDY